MEISEKQIEKTLSLDLGNILTPQLIRELITRLKELSNEKGSQEIPTRD